MTGLPAEIIDAHHHLWDLEAVDYPWLMARGVQRFFGDPTPIQRPYQPADFQADWEGLPVIASVHVQVGAADGLAETRWLERLQPPVPAAIVAETDLTAPDLADRLDALCAASLRLRGIRQIVGRHPSEDARTGSPALLDDPRFLAGLRILARRGLSFDLQLTAPLLPRAAALFAQVPGLQLALCHAGSPWDQSPAGLEDWRAGLNQLAALPTAHVKLSGLGMFNPAWTPATLAPVVDAALAAFGPERTMWGSNFPVDRLYRGYRPLLETIAALVPSATHHAVFAGTARRFYRL
ncbi:amidohydrolase family protein [Sandarakinorhabdus cyanobacteriorum]|uniref:amidohydrolase family protein n=1 Tax=Sandarakinorhabdus cyanobacteriorum TaxID=1981098 RepID=UPI001A9C5EA2|nr:amidohydrolase family protein [Sandarakinorhabdus cyanobacteriorum]